MIELEKIKPIIEKLAKKHRLSLVLLFGSRVSGKIHKHSDYDIAVLGDKPLDLMEEGKMVCDFFSIFQTQEIDLVDLKKAPPLLMKKIFDENKILFCGDLEIYYKYQSYALKRFIEARQLFEAGDDFFKFNINKFRQELRVL